MDRRSFHRIALLVCLPGLAISTAGCGYPEVSPRAYEIAKALYAITNRRQTDKLDVVTNLVEESRGDGTISDAEAGWLMEIVEEGRAGEWKSANERSRALMEDQIEW